VKYFSGIITLVITLLLSTQFSLAANITAEPSSPKVNESVTFTLTTSSLGCVRWSFGDGSNTAVPGGNTTVQHSYAEAGTYEVKALSGLGCDGGMASVGSLIITVGVDKPKITHQPRRPSAGQKVVFKVVNFKSKKCIKWDFNDGTERVKERKSPSEITHVFKKNGRYTVTAYDECGNKKTATRQIGVGRDTRSATFSPSKPKVGQRVTFRSRGDYSSCLKYDFGDGTIRSGSSTITHVYRKSGTFTFKVYGYCGDDENPQIGTIDVAGFDITYVDLRFNEKSINPTVDKHRKDFKAYATIKFAGTGIIALQWLVDNKVLQIKTKPARFSSRLVIDSGVDLPTHTPGPHTVTVRFMNPRGVSFKIPILRYYVSPGQQEQPSDDNDISITLNTVTDKQGVIQPIEKSSIFVGPGEYGIINGTIENNSDHELIQGQLLVYLESALLDKQVLLSIPAAGRKSFTVSMKNNNEEQAVQLQVINQAGKVIATKEISIQSAAP